MHRIALFGPHGDITNIISQMDVVKFLARRLDALGPLAGTTLEALGLVRRQQAIVSVDANMPTLAAFAMLAAKQLAGAPVVAEDGAIIANISISDLRYERVLLHAVNKHAYPVFVCTFAWLGQVAGVCVGQPHH